MTAQHVEHAAPKRGYIDRTLDAVTVAITTHAIDPERTARFVREFHEAWAAADQGETADITPLRELVEKWWPTAAMWDADPDGARHAYAAAVHIREHGPCGGGLTREQIRERYGL